MGSGFAVTRARTRAYPLTRATSNLQTAAPESTSYTNSRPQSDPVARYLAGRSQVGRSAAGRQPEEAAVLVATC